MIFHSYVKLPEGRLPTSATSHPWPHGQAGSQTSIEGPNLNSMPTQKSAMPWATIMPDLLDKPKSKRRLSQTAKISEGKKVGPLEFTIVYLAMENHHFHWVNHHFQWVNPPLRWQFAIATLNYQRVNPHCIWVGKRWPGMELKVKAEGGNQ